MDMRDAVEADAEPLAALTDAPRDVMRNLIHDRTVRVIEENDEIAGFVSFDAREQTVHITQIDGKGGHFEDLLEEPIRFARAEGMAVELLIPEDTAAVHDAAAEVGFTNMGNGPTFDGNATTRFRMEDP